MSVKGVTSLKHGLAIKNIGFNKLVAVFAACCVVGFVAETAWCYFKNGYIESRKSLVYGPLSVAYGMGGVLLTLVLYHFADCKWYTVFWVSFLVGSVAEYICSLGQEIVFGSVAWDYSHLPLNINGRVCLLYSLFWGALGVLWVKAVMPLTDKLCNMIPENVGTVLVVLFCAFFVYDSVLSAAAATRMNRRDAGAAPRNSVEIYLDKHFTDERMHKIYANSKKVG